MLSKNIGKLQDYEVVPWRSREEWLDVCDLICSDDPAKLQEAYDRLRSWKARHHRVAAGVECTIMILEPILMEQNMTEPSNELAIKSVYALAITRFLNTASSFDKERVPTTLYKIAQNLSIPEWIVNIRHEAAHSPDLPTLGVLRAAVHFSLQWLRSIYWEKGSMEDQQEENDEVPHYDIKGKLKNWCEIYQDIYYQKIKGILLTKDIKDQKLIKKTKEYLLGDEESVDGEDFETSKKFHTLNALIDELIMRLNSVFYEAVQSGCEVREIFKCFLQVSDFLPHSIPLQRYVSDKDVYGCVLTWHMKKMWAKVIKDVFQNHGALLEFLSELVDYNSGDNTWDLIAAHWIKEIANGIALAQVALLVEENENLSAARPRYFISGREIALYNKARVICENPDWRFAINLSLNNIPTTDELVGNIILSPRKFSMVYLPDLMQVTKEKLPAKKRKMILKYVDIILNQTTYIGDNGSKRQEVYCMNQPVHRRNEEEKQLGTSDSAPVSIWKGVPFGSLPLGDG